MFPVGGILQIVHPAMEYHLQTAEWVLHILGSPPWPVATPCPRLREGFVWIMFE